MKVHAVPESVCNADANVPPEGTKPEIDKGTFVANNGLLCWSDASFGTVRSHGGHILMYFGAAVCWASRRLKVVCLSSREAEVVAGVGAAKDIRFMRHLTDFFKVPIIALKAP